MLLLVGISPWVQVRPGAGRGVAGDFTGSPDLGGLDVRPLTVYKWLKLASCDRRGWTRTGAVLHEGSPPFAVGDTVQAVRLLAARRVENGHGEPPGGEVRDVGDEFLEPEP